MEIERKFLIKKEQLPACLKTYPHSELEQAYLITDPVLRVRRSDDQYILTYKGPGFLSREEHEFPLTKESYSTLLAKADGTVLSKTRYRIPEEDGLTIELDVFHGALEGLFLAEVEFPTEETALAYLPPLWFGEDVTHKTEFHNSTLSRMQPEEMQKLLEQIL